MKPKRMYAAMLRGPTGEFWAVVGPDRSPAEPYARSKEEFELKLAAEGLALGREMAPEEAGLPTGFCVDYGVRTFEIGRLG